MTNNQPIYYIVYCITKFASFADAKTKAPDKIAEHIRQSKQLHTKGVLLMAGAFLDEPGQPLTTMGVLTSQAAAEEYMQNDPFVISGMVEMWHIRKWANMFAEEVS